MLITDILDSAAARGPDDAALVDGGRKVSYAELRTLASRFATALAERGIRPGDRVGVCLSNRWEYPVAYFGIAYAGAVSVHLPVRFARGELEHVLGRIPLAALVTEPAMTNAIGVARVRLEAARLLILGEGYDLLADLASRQGTLIRVTDESPSAILFTSGTTGLPKGAVQPHHGRVVSARVAIEDFGLDAKDVLAIASPLYHAAGLYTWYQAGVLAGARAVLLGPWDPGAFVDAIAASGITGAFAVPTQLAMLLRDPRFDPARMRTLRIIVYGGAPSDPEVIEALAERLPWVRLVQNYGQTETGPLFSLQPEDRKRDPRALGRPNPLVEIGLFTAPGIPAGPGDVGEIATRGPHVCIGYYDDETATQGLFKGNDAWAWTGDLAIRHDDGLLQLVGRSKDTIISGGVNIYPAEIERALAMHPAVADCAAFGIPDTTWGELPVVAVVLKAGAQLSLPEAEAFLEPRIARFKRPRALHCVDALPYTPVGKLIRSVLRDRFQSAS